MDVCTVFPCEHVYRAISLVLDYTEKGIKGHR